MRLIELLLWVAAFYVALGAFFGLALAYIGGHDL